MEDILARMAGEAAAKNNKPVEVEKTKEKHRKIGNRARNFMGRIFRTGTELRNLLEVTSFYLFYTNAIFRCTT